MKIVGCDFHPSYQQVAVFDTLTGEVEEMKLMRADGQAERFYRQLEVPARIGMEATGNSLWWERLVQGLGHELWMGDAAQIRASYVRKQKTDKRDAGHILKLLLEDRFPKLWVPDQQQRDVRQLLVAPPCNVFLRRLLVEAAQSAVRHDPHFKKEYQHRCHHKAKGIAKVATARKLAVRLYWMLKTSKPYPEVLLIEGSPRHLVAAKANPSC